MNFEIFDITTHIATAIGTGVVKEDRDTADQYGLELVALSDKDLKSRCLQAINGEDIEILRERQTLLSSLTSYLAWFRRRASSLTAKRLALGIEAFKRAPADLPAGSALYAQQIQAAISLTHRCLIQMNTGEGKTYALLPAAFTLACEYNRVYIVCANDYLAWRDASRTRPFWEFVGLSQSLCLSSDDDGWSSRVIYTTLKALMFTHMGNVNQKDEPEMPISFGAVLLDEADAILLDEGTQPFNLIQEVEAQAFDWTFALEYAGMLTEGEEIETDYGTLQANLTIKGESRLHETLAANQLGSYLLTRLAVELAYVALKVAIENTHYVVADNQVRAVDLVTGKIQLDFAPAWVIPLEVKMEFPARAEEIVLDTLDPLTLLKRFQHLSGLSGTIAEDSLEYFFLYFLPTLIIEPRMKRHDGVQSDLFYRTKEEAYEALCEKVKEAVSAGRPVLVGAQTIADAENSHALLSELIEGPAPRLLTGKNDQQTAQVFESSGEVGSVVVATQLAGRGVDIRLSPEARKNGGLALFCLGHSKTIRHDKQFLGRAGRQGDPFTARFICSYQDELLTLAIGRKADKVMQMLGQEEGVAIESPMVTRRVAYLQNSQRRHLFWQNQQQGLLNANSFEIRQLLENWFAYAQLQDPDHPSECSEEFLEWVIDFYTTNVLTDALSVPRIGTAEATQITQFLNSSLGLTDRNSFLVTDFEGRDVHNATLALKQLLLKKIRDANGASRKLREVTFLALANPPEDGSESNDGDGTFEAGGVITVSWEAFERYQKTRERSPRKIAFWSIRSRWMAFIQERNRIIFRAEQKSLSYMEQYRMIVDQVSREWRTTEKGIATSVLRNLLRSAQPFELDELFVYEDNRVSPEEKKPNEFHWESSPTKPVDRPDSQKDISVLIGQFVAQSVGEMNEEFEVANLRRLLFDFSERNPLYVLQSPAQIKDALDAWEETEKERGFNSKLRKLHAKWLQRFLLFLRGRKLVAGPPTLQTHIKSTLTKFVRNIRETRTALATGGAAAFLLFFFLMTHWGYLGQRKSLSPFTALVDQILFAGLLAKGNVTAPAFGVLYISFLITVFMFPHTVTAPKHSIGFFRVLARTLQLFFAWWLTDWYFGHMTLTSILRSASVFVAILFVSLVTQRVVFLLEDTVGLSLLAGGLSYGVGLVCIPSIISTQPVKWTLVVFVAVVVALYNIWQTYSSEEVELVSTLLKSSRSMHAEEIAATLKVEANCGISPHVYAILSAWLTYQILTSAAVSRVAPVAPRTLLVVPFTVYVVVLMGRIAYMINRKLSVEMWQRDLNERHQIIRGAYAVPDLTQKLSATKRRLLARELSFQIVIVIAAVFLINGAILQGTLFSLSLIMIFAAFLLAVSIRTFGLQLYKLLYNRMPLDIEVLDFSSVPDKGEKRSAWQRTKRVVKIGFGLFMAAYSIVEVITSAHDILVKLKILH